MANMYFCQNPIGWVKLNFAVLPIGYNFTGVAEVETPAPHIYTKIIIIFGAGSGDLIKLWEE